MIGWPAHQLCVCGERELQGKPVLCGAGKAASTAKRREHVDVLVSDHHTILDDCVLLV